MEFGASSYDGWEGSCPPGFSGCGRIPPEVPGGEVDPYPKKPTTIPIMDVTFNKSLAAITVLVLAAAAFALIPGVLVRLPPGYSPMVQAGFHAVVIAVVLGFLCPPVIREAYSKYMTWSTGKKSA